nr:PREDICTED: uncharacterized protein LOC103281379 [Anolis carolinensis]|eukprot:XP_008121037.1 PREDICTED: uncharacterized protein LOC103281379 [Anolis carolinensis]
MLRLSKTIEKTVAANMELQRQLRATTGFTKGCHEILKEARAMFSEKATQVPDDEEKPKPTIEELNQKLEQLSVELNLQISENKDLSSENEWRKENLQQVVMDNAYLKKVMAVLWETVTSLKAENDNLRSRLIVFVEKEIAAKLPKMEEKKEYVERVALNLKEEADRLKALTEERIPRLLPVNASRVRRLQEAYEQTTSRVCSLLDEVKYYFPVWLKDSGDYYLNISTCSADLLQENVQQLRLLMETQTLEKADEWCQKFRLSRIPALRAKLDEFLENILQDASRLEQELHDIEAKVQEMESGRREQRQYVAKCSAVFCLPDFAKGIRRDTKNLQALLGVLKSKSQALTKVRSEVVTKHACVCWEAEAVIVSCRKKSLPEHQEAEELLDEAGAADARELEEAQRLEHNLSSVEQDMTAQLDAAAELEKEEMEKLPAQDANSSES